MFSPGKGSSCIFTMMNMARVGGYPRLGAWGGIRMPKRCLADYVEAYFQRIWLRTEDCAAAIKSGARNSMTLALPEFYALKV